MPSVLKMHPVTVEYLRLSVDLSVFPGRHDAVSVFKAFDYFGGGLPFAAGLEGFRPVRSK